MPLLLMLPRTRLCCVRLLLRPPRLLLRLMVRPPALGVAARVFECV
jgi:hypothetical protein